MRTFTVQLIFSITCQEADCDTEQYEEQWRIIMANSEAEALDAARAIGKDEESPLNYLK